jgi:transcriptional regulator with XRE-family HTH domain
MPNRIKQLRKKHNVTQEELGNIIGIKKSAVAKYESGDIENIKKASAEKIAEFFGVTPAYVFGWSDMEHEITSDESELLESYSALNALGKRQAKKMVKELADNIVYSANIGLDPLMPVAAHSDGADKSKLKSDIEKAVKLFGDKM